MSVDQTGAAGAAIYSRAALSVYDIYVLGFSNKFAWRCPSRRLLAHYNAHVSDNHLDIGVGTGYFLDKCRFPSAAPRLVLLDLNSNSLEATANRLKRYQPETVQANVLEPLPALAPGFDSVGLNYLLHCLPGTMAEKAAVFDQLLTVVNPGGVIFGSTILGQGVRHNLLGRRLMALYNSKGIFGNRQDTAERLRQALERNFAEVDIEVVGCVAKFVARRE